ncbi:MAG: DUF3305 domain-containing protein [Hyphomicrobiales bacterium]|nr:DUF3305 domain-containing protein [Hyphomicrobiales bacterium]
MKTIENREISIPLGIIVEKRKSVHPWADWIWRPVAVLANAPDTPQWRELIRGDDFIRYHADTLPMLLHYKLTEAYRENLMLDEPVLYVVLQETAASTREFPYAAHAVTASSYEAQDFVDADDNIVEKVAMPEELASLVQAFVEEHHVEEVFKKRRRDKLDVEEQKFGKTPIFTPRNRQ